MSEQTVEVTLNVAYVGEGGNGGDGKFFYSYEPAFVPVSNPDTIINYSLHSEAQGRYSIYSYALCDPDSQITEADLNKETGVLKIKDSCSKDNVLVLLSILVQDSETGTIIDCDPQVTNVPPPD